MSQGQCCRSVRTIMRSVSSIWIRKDLASHLREKSGKNRYKKEGEKANVSPTLSSGPVTGNWFED